MGTSAPRVIVTRPAREATHWVAQLGAQLEAQGVPLKLAVNLPLLTYYQALGEAYTLCRQTGLDPAWLVELFADTSGGSNILKIRGAVIAQALAGGDTAVTIKAAAQQTSGVNAAMAYGTDGPVAALGLQTLSDPQGVQPIYAPTPVVREAVLKAYPQIADWLQPVFASLDEKTLQQLNARIAVEGQDAKRVAADYLQQKGLLK